MSLVLQVFVFRDGAFLGTEMATGERLEIGRDPECAVRLDDDACSRRHALIFETEGRLAIQDLGSANGTLLNGEPLTAPRYLSARDDIVIGSHTLKVKPMSAVSTSGPSPVATFDGLPPTQLADGGVAVAPPAASPQRSAPYSPPAAPGAPAPVDALISGEGAPASSGPTAAAPALVGSGSALVASGPSPGAPGAVSAGAPLPFIEHHETTDPVPRRRGREDSPASDLDATLPEQPRASLGTELVDGSGEPMPSLAWSPSDWDEDDDEEDFVPSWSLVQRLVRAPVTEEKSDGSIVEVVHYRGEAVVDHAVLDEGEAFRFGRNLGREGLGARGLRRPWKMLQHRKGNVVELRLDERISGRVLRHGQQIDVRSLPEAQGGKGRVPLTEGDLASLDIGGDRVFVRFAKRPHVTPPPDMLTQMKEDRRLVLTSVGTAVGLFLLLGIVGWIWQYRAHSQQVIQLEDDGFAEVIEKVELELEEPEPEPPKVEEPPPKPEKTPPPEMKQPEVAKSTPVKSKEPPKPKAIDVLSKIPKLNDKASSQNLSAAMSNIKGVRVPGASGFKVSGLIGKGPSSGVQIGGAAGGLETSGINSVIRKTGGVGGLTGKKDRRIRGRVAALKQRSKVKGQGQLSREEIQKVINQGISQIQYCYEKQLRTTPNLHGKVVLEWTIKPDGRVGVVKSAQSTLQSAAAINCMMGKVKSWRFPKPRGNGSVIVTYPFIFNTL